MEVARVQVHLRAPQFRIYVTHFANTRERLLVYDLCFLV
jgi:hypothetical protein